MDALEHYSAMAQEAAAMRQATEQAVQAMESLGGSFVRSLAHLWRLADPSNQRRIELAFEPEFDRYAVLAKQVNPEVRP